MIISISQFIAVLIANLAIWQLPWSLSYLICLIAVAIVVPTAVPRSWKL